jgi:uncharacterized protein YjbI with pentapeptide repeats
MGMKYNVDDSVILNIKLLDTYTYSCKEINKQINYCNFQMNKKRLTTSEIIEMIAQHEIWFESNQHEGVQANFSGINLRGTDFIGAKLDFANFGNAYLNEANFSNASLNGVTFGATSLVDSIFDDASLVGTNFQNANLRYATFKGANLTNALFQGADLTRARFDHATLDAGIARAMNISGATFPENVTRFLQTRRSWSREKLLVFFHD